MCYKNFKWRRGEGKKIQMEPNSEHVKHIDLSVFITLYSLCFYICFKIIHLESILQFL